LTIQCIRITPWGYFVIAGICSHELAVAYYYYVVNVSTHVGSAVAVDASLLTRNGWKSPGTRCGARNPAVHKEEDCFAVPVDSIVDDFDFEKNLALFDKRAVFDKIEQQRERAGSATPTASAAAASSSSPRPADAKYRCDENVLPRRKAVYRQILVSNSTDVVTSCEYVTDSGLIVPSVQPAVRNRLIAAGVRSGFDRGRQIEMVGRSAAEMVLQLLGGGSRYECSAFVYFAK